jgi:hypothetical protein
MKPAGLLAVVLALLCSRIGLSAGVDMLVSADPAADALEELRTAVLKKIDFDIERNATAFADAQNIHVSVRWSDWFGWILDISKSVFDGLSFLDGASAIKKPTSVRAFIKSGVEGAGAVDSIFDFVGLFDRLRQDGENLQLALDGPSYTGGVKNMLNRANEIAFPLGLFFDYPSYKTSIKNDLYGITSSETALPVLHKSSSFNRTGGGVFVNINAAENYVIAQIRAMSSYLRGRLVFQSDLVKLVAFIKARHSDVLRANVSSTSIAYSTFLLKDGTHRLQHVNYSLGALGSLDNFRATMLSAYADNVDVEIRIRAAEFLDLGVKRSLKLPRSET